MGMWFPLATRDDELEMLVAEKSPALTRKWRLPKKEARPVPTTGEWVLHHEFFGRGLGFPLHKFMHRLLFFYGCQLHHLTPNGILHIENFITFCECFLGMAPHFELFHYFF